MPGTYNVNESDWDAASASEFSLVKSGDQIQITESGSVTTVTYIDNGNDVNPDGAWDPANLAGSGKWKRQKIDLDDVDAKLYTAKVNLTTLGLHRITILASLKDIEDIMFGWLEDEVSFRRRGDVRPARPRNPSLRRIQPLRRRDDSSHTGQWR